MTAVIPIVEGHGEQQCVRVLLQRIGSELLKGRHIDVLRPIRVPRSKLVRRAELEKAVELAARKATALGRRDALILIMIDADRDAACELGPRLVEWARECRHDFEIGCVLIVVEYETWFVGGVESLRDHLDCPVPAPETPEYDRQGKGWIQHHVRGPSYSETIDQPAMTATVDLDLVRARCPSFGRLCRIIEDHVARE